MSALPDEAPVAAPPRKGSWSTVVLLGVTLLAAILVVAASGYYFAPLGQRVRHPLHAWLRPSGFVGQSLGLVAFLGFVFLWMYPIRKRVRGRLAAGSIARWLDVHIVVGLLMPLLAATHAGWRFTGLIGLGFLAMVIVWASGVAGRYIYVRIPRSKNGIAMGLDEVRLERLRLLHEISATTGLPYARLDEALRVEPLARGQLGLVGVIRQFILDDLRRQHTSRELVTLIASSGVPGHMPTRKAVREAAGLARRQIGLEQQMRMLEGTQRVFKFWHAAHLPVAITALIAVFLHVAVAVVMGATWFW